MEPRLTVCGNKQEAIDRSCTSAPNHQNDQSRKQEEVKLITLALLCAGPVHKEPELMMDHCNRDNHVARDPKGCNPGQEAEDKTQSAEEFRGNGQKCEYSRNVHDSGEEAHRASEAISAEPSQHLLRTVGEEDHPEHQSKNGYCTVIVGSNYFSHRNSLHPNLAARMGQTRDQMKYPDIRILFIKVIFEFRNSIPGCWRVAVANAGLTTPHAVSRVFRIIVAEQGHSVR